jgi:hypothetical protein
MYFIVLQNNKQNNNLYNIYDNSYNLCKQVNNNPHIFGEDNKFYCYVVDKIKNNIEKHDLQTNTLIDTYKSECDCNNITAVSNNGKYIVNINGNFCNILKLYDKIFKYYINIDLQVLPDTRHIGYENNITKFSKNNQYILLQYYNNIYVIDVLSSTVLYHHIYINHYLSFDFLSNEMIYVQLNNEIQFINILHGHICKKYIFPKVEEYYCNYKFNKKHILLELYNSSNYKKKLELYELFQKKPFEKYDVELSNNHQIKQFNYKNHLIYNLNNIISIYSVDGKLIKELSSNNEFSISNVYDFSDTDINIECEIKTPDNMYNELSNKIESYKSSTMDKYNNLIKRIQLDNIELHDKKYNELYDKIESYKSSTKNNHTELYDLIKRIELRNNELTLNLYNELTDKIKSSEFNITNDYMKLYDDLIKKYESYEFENNTFIKNILTDIENIKYNIEKCNKLNLTYDLSIKNMLIDIYNIKCNYLIRYNELFDNLQTIKSKNIQIEKHISTEIQNIKHEIEQNKTYKLYNTIILFFVTIFMLIIQIN